MPSTTSSIHPVTDETFEPEVLKSETPVLVDYWAEWCGPCKSIAPILDEVAKEYEGRLKIAKLNVDENQQTAAAFDVLSIPTLILFKNGQVAAMKVGALPKNKLQEWVEQALSTQ